MPCPLCQPKKIDGFIRKSDGHCSSCNAVYCL